MIKDTKLKVQAKIQGNELRISGAKKDNLQDSTSELEMQSAFFMESGTVWNINGSNYNVDLYGRANIKGTVYVAQGINFNFRKNQLIK